MKHAVEERCKNAQRSAERDILEDKMTEIGVVQAVPFRPAIQRHADLTCCLAVADVEQSEGLSSLGLV